MLWEFSNSAWEQDDRLKQFIVKRIFGRDFTAETDVPLEKLIGAKKHPVSGDPCEKSLFPSDFKFCPFCGRSLIYDSYSSPLWIAPYGSENGLKLLSRELSDKIDFSGYNEIGSEFQLPSTHGRISFCSLKLGAQQRLLLVVNKEIGQIWIYRPDKEEKWKPMSGRAGVSGLPTWSWSSATDSHESGLCIPTDQGPAWINFDWISGRIDIDRADGNSIGGPVRVDKYLLAPVMRENRFVIVFRKDGEPGWHDCSSKYDSSAVTGQLSRKPEDAPYLGIPYIDEIRHIAYWSCRGGYIKVVVGDQPDELSWDFRTWENDEQHPATALIELGPPYRETALPKAGFWQLCHDFDPDARGDGTVYKEIKIDGNGNERLLESEGDKAGQFLTTGNAAFSWLKDYLTGIHSNYSLRSDQNEIRFPLLQFGEKGLVLVVKAKPVEGFDEFGRFTDIFFSHNSEKSAFIRFVIQGQGIPDIKLYADGVDVVSNEKIKIGLANLPEITSFIYENSFYIYLPDRNLCFTWPIKFMGV